MKSATLDPEILEALNMTGPALSSTVAKTMVASFGLSETTARKKIERAKTSRQIHALGVRFKHNEQFVYLRSQVGTSEFRQNLFDTLRSLNSVYYLPLAGIAARGGIVLEKQFATISGLRTRSENETTALKALDVLLESGLLEQINNPGGKCLRLSSHLAKHVVSDSRMLARLEMENTVINAFGDWLRLQGLAASDVATTRETRDEPQFGYFQWDFVAPSYAYPLQQTAAKPGFVVADIHLGRKITTDDLQYFLHKCREIRHSHQTPFMAFCIASWFEKDAFMLGRQNSVVLTTPKNFFGKAFSLSIDLLTQALESRDYLAQNSDFMIDVLEVLDEVQHLKTAINSIKHSLYKLIVGRLIQKLYGGTLSYAGIETAADSVIDLVARSSDKIVAVKLKYMHKPVAALTIQQWLQSFAKLSAVIDNPSGIQTEYWFCTSTTFSDEAIALLQQSEIDPRWTIRWHDRASLHNLVEKVAEPAFSLALRKIFEED